MKKKLGPGHVLECMGLPSMDVKVATPWGRHTCISMEPHGITGLTCTKFTTVDSLEFFHGSAMLTVQGGFDSQFIQA